jgi:pimeloyl-ACP methyl ester carboxylesterase
MPEIAGVFVREIGEGKPVVLLHPGPGLDGSVFLPGVMALAQAGHRVLLVDLPGNGRSPDGDRAEWTLAGYARSVQRLAEALDLRDWALLGHSFGGYVALQHLVDHPGAAARLILSCTDSDEDPPVGLPEPPEPEGAVLEALEREATVSTPEECREVWLAQLPFFSPEPERASGMLRDVVFRADVHHTRDWGELHALQALAAASIPVLAIGAGRDPAFPIALAERIGAAAPNSTVLALADSGHFPFAEHPDSYWGAVITWLGIASAG